MIGNLRIVHEPILHQAINGHKPIDVVLIKFLMMVKHDTTKKLLLISLDGLSAEQFHYLSTNMGLSAFAHLGTVAQLSAGQLNSPQAIWGEILSGKKWFESGCAGYAFPKSSLNDLEVGRESSYQFGTILNEKLGNSLISVNMPLLEASSSRIWLPDGSFSQDKVSPRSLIDREPFQSYRGRPFTSAAYFLGNPKLGFKHCVDTEKIRLQCALQLIKEEAWQTCLVRLSLFDLLANLFGSHYLFDEKLVLRSELEAFLEFADGIFSKMLQHLPDATICVVSAYSNQECKRRINLNLLLSHAGWCQLADVHSVKEDFIARQEAVLAIAGSLSKPYRPTALASITNKFSSSSMAASPTCGAVYLNSKERFADGILSKGKATSIKNEIADYIQQRLQDEGAGEIQIELKPDSGTAIAPDLLISADNAAFHDLYEAPAIDNFSHPASCFSAKGFVGISRQDLKAEMSTIQLNNLLSMRLN